MKSGLPEKLKWNMKCKLLFAALVALAILAAIFWKPPQNKNSSALKNAVILVIRHAEKPDQGDSLSPAGEARALAYIEYFRHFKIGGQPIKPDYLFATADSSNSRRPRLTIEPVSRELGLTIDSRFKDNQFLALAHEIQGRFHGTNMLICWHHGKIPQLLRALGADPKKLLPNGKWPDDVFGWLIQLRYDENGHLFESKRINENLAPADSGKSAPASS
jgi:hypothetical protein